MSARRAAAVLATVLALIAGVSACQAGSGRTYLTPFPGEPTFGANRLLNACQLAPPELADQAFGVVAPGRRLVEEVYADGSLDGDEIPDEGHEVSRCRYGTRGGTVSITLEGYPDAETARRQYGEYRDRTVTGDEGPVDDGDPSGQQGVRGNYRYRLTFLSAPPALSEEVVTRGVRELAATLVRRIDQPGLSGPMDVSGMADVDACGAFTAAAFGAALRADTTSGPIDRRPDPGFVERTYTVSAGSPDRAATGTEETWTRGVCRRKSHANPAESISPLLSYVAVTLHADPAAAPAARATRPGATTPVADHRRT